MELKSHLEKLGLTKTEAELYHALIKHGESTAVQIAKTTKIHRRTIYDNINLLIRKGLVSTIIKNKVKYFKASNPLALKTMLEEKNKILFGIMPLLKANYENPKKTAEVGLYVGVEGAKSLIEEVMEKKKTLYWIGAGGILFDSLGYSKNFVKEKLSKLDIKMVQPDGPGTKSKMRNFRNARILPKEFSFKSSLASIVYGDTVALGIIEEKEFTVVKIESKGFARGIKNYFDILWKISKPCHDA